MASSGQWTSCESPGPGLRSAGSMVPAGSSWFCPVLQPLGGVLALGLQLLPKAGNPGTARDPMPSPSHKKNHKWFTISIIPGHPWQFRHHDTTFFGDGTSGSEPTASPRCRPWPRPRGRSCSLRAVPSPCRCPCAWPGDSTPRGAPWSVTPKVSHLEEWLRSLDLSWKTTPQQ